MYTDVHVPICFNLAQGQANPKCAGSLAAITDIADTVLPDADTPVISIESSYQ